MNSYRKKIFALAEESKAEVFFNSSPDHAAVVHNAIAKYSKDHIYILCRSFCDDKIVDNKAETKLPPYLFYSTIQKSTYTLLHKSWQ